MTKGGARGYILIFGVIGLIVGLSTNDTTSIWAGVICLGIFILSILVDKNPNW